MHVIYVDVPLNLTDDHIGVIMVIPVLTIIAVPISILPPISIELEKW